MDNEVHYGEPEADAFLASRHLPQTGLSHWRDAVAGHLQPRDGLRVLDLGAGTGMWAAAFTRWYGASVVAVEPSAAMRARSRYRPTVAGHAGAIPLRDGSVDGAWLSTVIHHVPDLAACAAELRRTLRPGAPVLIRQVFPGRQDQVTLLRFFPEAAGVVAGFPSVTAVRSAFAAAGFGFVTLAPVPQETAPSLASAVAALRRDAHTPLKLITDEQFDAGLARMRAAARHQTGPVIDALDLLVLRSEIRA